jgi:shikimate dehydrogenase
MSKLSDIQEYLTNDLKIFKEPFFENMKEIRVVSPSKDKVWEDLLYSVPNLDYFEPWYICGIVGGRQPSTYSESPKLWNRYFKDLGVDGVFFGFDLPPDKDFHEFLDTALAIPEVLDVTVTDPYKSIAYEALKSQDVPVEWMDQAENAQAVNHILIDSSRKSLKALNTDGIGMVWAIQDKSELSGKKVLIIGAGGAAASIGYEIVRNGCALTILNRTPSKAEDLKRLLEKPGGSPGSIRTGGFKMLPELADEIDIIITTVPEGCPITGENIGSFRDDVILIEAKYGPKTDLRDIASREGLEYMDGKAMLFGQFVEAASFLYPLLPVPKDNHEMVIEKMKGEWEKTWV